MDKDIRCEHCGLPKSEHWAANYADGQIVSGVVLICPSSIFKPRRYKEIITVKKTIEKPR